MESQSGPAEPSADDVRWDKRIPDPPGPEDGIPEDIEHVVPVVGEGEGMDDGVDVCD